MSKAATNGDTVRVHYKGTLSGGEVFDSSEGRDPLEFTLGESQVIAGFEQTVEGMEVGETRKATIAAADAYGEPRPDLQVQVPRSDFPDGVEPELGQQLGLKQPNGQTVPVRVVGLAPEKITLDANHPLAGKDLTFEIELVELVGS